MHQAPSVVYPLGGAQTLRIWVTMAWLLVTGVDVYWLVQAPALDWRLGLGLALTALAGACAYRFWPAQRGGFLQWDGDGWSYREGEREITGQVTAQLDLQSALLVFWAPASGTGSWHWLRSATQPSQWLAFRRAVFTPARTSQGGVDGVRADQVARP